MQVLIDGHNLIPKIHGMNLGNLDDEVGLIPLLQEYSRVKRHTVEVFFDGAPPGQPAVRKFGSVRANFIRQGRTADAAIIARVRKAGKSAASWLVVSSDRHIQVQVRAMGCKTIGAEEFAAELMQLSSANLDGDAKHAERFSAAERDEFYKMFGIDE